MSNYKQIIVTKQDEETITHQAVVDLPSLRDQIAMAALPALIRLYYEDTCSNVSNLSYDYADAMMEARK